MNQVREHDERVTGYLLGRLTEAEQTSVEQEYFSNPEKFEEVWAVENDLVDAYVRGQLSGGERELFERNYLPAPGNRERVAFAASLREMADCSTQKSDSTSQVVEPSASSWKKRFMETLIAPRSLQIGLVTATLLLLIAGFAWLALERERLRRELGSASAHLSDQQHREQEITNQLAAEREQSGQLKAELERLREATAQSQSRPSPTNRQSVFSFFLSPLLTRSESEPQQINIPRQTDILRLRMNVERNNALRFQATVRTVEGKRIWSQRSINARADNATVSIPASKLPLGDYILTLSATNSTGETQEVNRYFFRVLRK